MMKRIAILLFLAFFLVGLSPCREARSADIPHYLWLPYCVSGDGWWTGLHFKTNFSDDTITVGFSGVSTFYANDVAVPLNTRGMWTGTPQSLLSNPADFQSPTLLHIHSTKGQFTVTQFIGSPEGGFGFQTFYSSEGTSPENAWPSN